MENLSIPKLLSGELIKKNKMTDKQRAVLDAAISLFAEKGYVATSTSEIAKKAGVSEGLIFKHFGNKEKLLHSIVLPILMNDLMPTQVELLQEEVLDIEHPTFEQFLEALIRNRFRLIKENIEILKIMMTELMYRTEFKEAFHVLLQTKLKPVIEENQMLKKMKSEKIIVDWDNVEIIKIIATHILGYAFQRFILFPGVERDDEMELMKVKEVLLKLLLL